ncbi:hypothetical protein [Bifidobacterium longum]|uniref:hypothetical protein n=1 Tax=Bifidobacterium longum TaxID=216816 RepID=UPI001456215A|nr:hypothetical protein [Bifidobacterium longum]
MRLSAVHSTSVARTVSLDIKEHSGRSAMGVTSADRRNGTIGDGRVMLDRARPQSSPLQKDGVHPPHRANIRKQKPITRNPSDGNGNGIMAEPGTESAGKAKLRSRIGEIFLDGSGG